MTPAAAARGDEPGGTVVGVWPADLAGREPLDDATLAQLYAYPEDGCWVRANMVATLDGAGAGPDGRTGSLNTAADRRVFALLRGLADVVLVGAGTVRTEGYGPPRPVASTAHVRQDLDQAPAAVLAVVTRSGDVPPALLSPGTGTRVVTCEAAGADVLGRLRDRLGSERVLVTGGDDVDLTAALDDLADGGLARVLCEGGPRLLRDLAASGELDELCLTWVPRLLGGDAPRVLAGADVDLDLRPAHLLHADGALVGRWLVG
ncbi:dihydrofolate reductase family protein [Thalassiella azotivora]